MKIHREFQYKKKTTTTKYRQMWLKQRLKIEPKTEYVGQPRSKTTAANIKQQNTQTLDTLLSWVESANKYDKGGVKIWL